jgi:hypothetical protein
VIDRGAERNGEAGKGGLYPGPLPLDGDHPLLLAQKEDLQALGLALLETVFCALADGCPSDKTCGDALSRLLLDIYEKDTRAFRCAASPPPSPAPSLQWRFFCGSMQSFMAFRLILMGHFHKQSLQSHSVCEPTRCCAVAQTYHDRSPALRLSCYRIVPTLRNVLTLQRNCSDLSMLCVFLPTGKGL